MIQESRYSGRGGAHEFRVDRHGRFSRRWRSILGGLGCNDRRLECSEEPPLGAHLITPRFGFAHHGIYVGAWRVAHYGSFAHYWHRAPVEEVPVASFTHGHGIWIRPHATPRFDPRQVIKRARSRMGEDRYRLLSNNCEHFCEWCLQGEHRSAQVERLLTLPRRLLGIFGAVAGVLGGVPSARGV
jgi:hypothetical protein